MVITHSPILIDSLLYIFAVGAVDVPVASQIFKVTSITGYDYHIWALNNHSQHAQVLTVPLAHSLAHSLTHSHTHSHTHTLTHTLTRSLVRM